MVVPTHGIGDVLVVVQEVLLRHETVFVLGPPMFHEFTEHLALGHAVVQQLGVFGGVVQSGDVS